MRLPTPHAIRHDCDGFSTLVQIAADTRSCDFETIDIDMSRTEWLDADMCAPLGAIFYRLRRDLNTVNLRQVGPKIVDVLSKNGFLSHYGQERIPDDWGTTISYQRFDVTDDRFFAGYIEQEFIHREEIPPMSRGLLKKFRESIFEIFSNAVQHSETELGIFSCGQFFPRRNTLHFTVADLGIGMRQSIIRHKNLNLPPEDAIDWATRGNNTTKRGTVPGGLGLKLLREFIDLNGGSIQIVSDAGYWLRQRGETLAVGLNNAFDGTVVSLEIDTADTRSYELTSETHTDDIF